MGTQMPDTGGGIHQPDTVGTDTNGSCDEAFRDERLEWPCDLGKSRRSGRLGGAVGDAL